MTNLIPLESLADGTVIKTDILWNGLLITHYGTVRREWDGRIVIDQNSKRFGRAVSTDFDHFHDGRPSFVHRSPRSVEEGWEIATRTRADVERGVPWTIFDNCEDMVSRAVTGQNGSPTRNLFVGLAVVGLFVALVVNS